MELGHSVGEVQRRNQHDQPPRGRPGEEAIARESQKTEIGLVDTRSLVLGILAIVFRI